MQAFFRRYLDSTKLCTDYTAFGKRVNRPEVRACSKKKSTTALPFRVSRLLLSDKSFREYRAELFMLAQPETTNAVYGGLRLILFLYTAIAPIEGILAVGYFIDVYLREIGFSSANQHSFTNETTTNIHCPMRTTRRLGVKLKEFVLVRSNGPPLLLVTKCQVLLSEKEKTYLLVSIANRGQILTADYINTPHTPPFKEVFSGTVARFFGRVGSSRWW